MRKGWLEIFWMLPWTDLMCFLALRYRYRSGDSISHTQCLSCVSRFSFLSRVYVHFTFLRTPPSFFILACSNFIGMCRMTLPTNVNFQKPVFGSKKILKKYFSEKIIVFCELLIHFSSEPAQILQACAE